MTTDPSSWVAIAVTAITMIMSGVWFLARLDAAIRASMAAGDATLRGMIAEGDRASVREAEARLKAAGDARDAQVGTIVTDLRDLQRNAVSRSELKDVETRIGGALTRIEAKVDALVERVALQSHIGDSLRDLTQRLEAIDARR